MGAESTNADDPFCKTTAPKPEPKPAPLPTLFYCHDAAKFSKATFNKDATCARAYTYLEEHWDTKRLDPQDPDVLKFNKICCGERKTVVGKKYKRKIAVVKKKVVKVSTSLSLDMTDPKNNDKKEKFEKYCIKRAKAQKGTFKYTKKSSSRRHLAAGSSVTATLEYANDAAAEAGKTTVSGASFSTDL